LVNTFLVLLKIHINNKAIKKEELENGSTILLALLTFKLRNQPKKKINKDKKTN
jgi:hypothetical protein